MILNFCQGVVIFVVAFFGCCGAWHENTCMIYTYAAMLGLLLICEIGAGIAAFVLKGELKDVVAEKMVAGMKNYSKLNLKSSFLMKIVSNWTELSAV